MKARPGFLLFFFEDILAGAAKWAAPVFRERLKCCSWCNIAIRITNGGVVDILTDSADPTFHNV